MTTARRLGIAVNLIGMGFPFLFPQAQPGSGAYLAPLWSWPMFLFCLRGFSQGRLAYRDDDGGLWQLDGQRKPREFWWAMGLTSLAGWLLMLAMRAGGPLRG